MEVLIQHSNILIAIAVIIEERTGIAAENG